MTAGADRACLIDGDRLLRRLQALGEVGATGDGGVCRLALTDADREGRDLVSGWMRELGLRVCIDLIGNVVGVWDAEGGDGLVLTGSHIDTVACGGLYDGNLGVLAGLEAIESLREAGFRPTRSLGVAFFTNEEGARFSPDMLGSLVFADQLSVEDALVTRAIDGPLLGAELERAGYAGCERFSIDTLKAFVELHIEQGPILEAVQSPIGVVLGVQGIHWLEVEFIGEARHAGTTPMAMRRDAGAAAFALAAGVANLAKRVGGDQLATVGRVVLEPNLVNVVARRATMTVDLRNTDGDLLRCAAAEVADLALSIAEASGLGLEIRTLVDLDPVVFDPAVVDLVREEAHHLGLSTYDLPSGAGHDAQILARVCPAGMIFVPSAGGISHNPREHTDARELVQGAEVLTSVLRRLAA